MDIDISMGIRLIDNCYYIISSSGIKEEIALFVNQNFVLPSGLQLNINEVTVHYEMTDWHKMYYYNSEHQISLTEYQNYLLKH